MKYTNSIFLKTGTLTGDAVFLCNNEEVISSKKQKAMIIDVDDKITARKLEYNMENLIDYELNSRDTRIGEIN